MTAPAIDTETFISLCETSYVIDVRSPVEFAKGHIIGAVNIPLFEDMERAEIGTLYKQCGKEKAINRGLELVNPKKTFFVDKVKAEFGSKPILVYCFRGGMRSNSFAWFLNSCGFDTQILKGGYKSYRNDVLRYFAEPKNIVLLGGNTGSGKTDILRRFQKEQFPVIDIERLAHHKGSAFGTINESKQEPQQNFEHHLFNAFRAIQGANYCLMEDESQTLGFNKIPHPLWLQMQKGQIIKLIIPFELRIEKLLTDYTTIHRSLLQTAILKIAQQLGPVNTNLCLRYLSEDNLTEVARICLHYYDRAYEYKYSKKNNQSIIILESDTINTEENYLKIKDVLASL